MRRRSSPTGSPRWPSASRRPAAAAPAGALEYLRRLYYDTGLSNNAPALAATREVTRSTTSVRHGLALRRTCPPEGGDPAPDLDLLGDLAGPRSTPRTSPRSSRGWWGPRVSAAPRRVVTGHDAGGRSMVLSDGPAPRSHPVPGAVFHEVWNTPSVPAPVAAAEPREPTERPLVTPPDPGGTIIRIVDLEPGSVSPMHRTESVDYGIVLEGEVQLVLDDGSATALGRGDVVVQRGTDHAWENRTGARARMAFVLVDGRYAEELAAVLPAGALDGLYDHALD